MEKEEEEDEDEDDDDDDDDDEEEENEDKKAAENYFNPDNRDRYFTEEQFKYYEEIYKPKLKQVRHKKRIRK